MSFHPLRIRFLNLVHPDLTGRIDIKVETFPDAHDQPSRLVLLVDKNPIELGLAEWIQPDHSFRANAPDNFDAFKALDAMVNGDAPEYWKQARGRLFDNKSEISAATSGELDASGKRAALPENGLRGGTNCDRVVSALGWLDRRVGKRTIEADEKIHGNSTFSDVEKILRRIRELPEVPFVPVNRKTIGR